MLQCVPVFSCFDRIVYEGKRLVAHLREMRNIGEKFPPQPSLMPPFHRQAFAGRFCSGNFIKETSANASWFSSLPHRHTIFPSAA